MSRRAILDAVLLPAALVVVVLEDIVWAGLKVVLRQISGLPPLKRLEARLGRLGGWAALPLFLVPELIGRVGEVWAVALFVGGHVASGVAVYLLVRLVSTLIAVFVYHACEAALLQLRWFAAMVGWLARVRDWARLLTAVLRARLRQRMQGLRSRAARRFAAFRRIYAVNRFRQ